MISPSPYLLRTAEGWCKGASDSVELLPTAEAGDLPAVEQHSTRDPMYAATGHCTVVYARRRQRTVRLPEARALLRLRVVKSQRGALAPKYQQDHPQTGHRVRFARTVRLVKGARIIIVSCCLVRPLSRGNLAVLVFCVCQHDVRSEEQPLQALRLGYCACGRCAHRPHPFRQVARVRDPAATRPLTTRVVFHDPIF